MSLPDLVSPLVGERVSLAFSLLLVFHVFAGLTCVVTGAVAIISPKRRGRHPWFGDVYYWSLSVVFASATGLAGIRWSHDAYLFVLRALAFAVASIGYGARRIRWRGWTSIHILGMSASYAVLLTAFYVDNGPHLPLLNKLPVLVFWVGPSLIGLPLVARALIRHAHLLADIRATARALGELTTPVRDVGGAAREQLDLQAHFKVYAPFVSMRIGELASRTGLATSALRYYEAVGLLTSASRSESGYRLFGEESLGRLDFVRRAQALGLSVREIRELIDSHGATAAEERGRLRHAVAHKLAETDRRLSELHALRGELEGLYVRLRRAPSPECGHVGDCGCWLPTDEEVKAMANEVACCGQLCCPNCACVEGKPCDCPECPCSQR